jgi:hypothetical protein
VPVSGTTLASFVEVTVIENKKRDGPIRKFEFRGTRQERSGLQAAWGMVPANERGLDEISVDIVMRTVSAPKPFKANQSAIPATTNTTEGINLPRTGCWRH